jgi:hypothetical protein
LENGFLGFTKPLIMPALFGAFDAWRSAPPLHLALFGALLARLALIGFAEWQDSNCKLCS